MDTKPPSFRKAEEPLPAEEWLNTVEQKVSFASADRESKGRICGSSVARPYWHLVESALGGSSSEYCD